MASPPGGIQSSLKRHLRTEICLKALTTIGKCRIHEGKVWATSWHALESETGIWNSELKNSAISWLTSEPLLKGKLVTSINQDCGNPQKIMLKTEYTIRRQSLSRPGMSVYLYISTYTYVYIYIYNIHISGLRHSPGSGLRPRSHGGNSVGQALAVPALCWEAGRRLCPGLRVHP